jgi:hypothetical protein
MRLRLEVVFRIIDFFAHEGLEVFIQAACPGEFCSWVFGILTPSESGNGAFWGHIVGLLLAFGQMAVQGTGIFSFGGFVLSGSQACDRKDSVSCAPKGLGISRAVVGQLLQHVPSSPWVQLIRCSCSDCSMVFRLQVKSSVCGTGGMCPRSAPHPLTC